MSNRQATYTLNLNNNVIRSLEQTEAAALRVDGVMGELNRTMSMFGLAFGAGFVINIGKEWVQTAADYEQSMLRIKNASENAMEGLKNQFFIRDVVDRFKIDLESGLDAYGHFLFKIKNAKIGRDKENKLFEELTAVGKVSGLPQTEINSTIRNMSIMLGEGVLEARHLRALSYVHPQVIPFLADELGLKDNQRDDFSTLLKHSEEQDKEESKLQKLSQLISSGKLTKLGEPATLLLGAMDKYYESIKDKIPETLDLVQSEINDLGNAWLNFKQQLVLGDKPELTEFIHELTGGIKYLSAHSGEISKLAGDIGNLIKLYAGWRIGIMALQLPFGIMSFFRTETTRLTSTFGLYIPKVHEAAAANERLAATQTQLIVENEAYVETQTLATEADMRRVLGIAELNIAIEENTAAQAIQMDMFTESTVGRIGGEYELNLKLRELEQERIAQTEFANSELLAIEEAFVAKKEAILLADRHKFGYNVFQQKSQYNAEVVALNEQMIIDQQRVKSELIYIETEYQAKVAELRQAGFLQQEALGAKQLSLFEEVTVAGVEANSKIASSAKIAADESAAAWVVAAEEAEAAWIGLSEAMTASTLAMSSASNTAAAVSGINSSSKGLLGKVPALLSSAIMPVFIAGMAIEVADMMLPGNSKTKEGLTMSNWANTLFSFGFDWYGDGEGMFAKAKRLGSEEGINKGMQAEIDKYLNVPKFDFLTGQVKQPFLDPKGHDLYNVLVRTEEKIQRLNLETGYDLNYHPMDIYAPKDKFGNRKTSNMELYDMFKGKGDRIPYLDDRENESYFPFVSLEAKHQSEEQQKQTRAIKDLSKASTRLKGNSVTNIHISWTGGMNGMTNPKFVVNNMTDMEEIEEKVGSILVKKLTDAVNDAQYLH